MKRIFIFIIILTGFNYAENSLKLSDPARPNNNSEANVRNAIIEIYPGLAYTKLDLTFEINNYGTNFEIYEAQQEIIYKFELDRKQDFITNSFLWVGDTLVEGLLIDLWTASDIYEQTVDRRQDPSILQKVDAINYELNVYPLLDSNYRKIKISFNLLNELNNNNVKTSFPMIFNFLGKSSSIVEVFIKETEEYTFSNIFNIDLDNGVDFTKDESLFKKYDYDYQEYFTENNIIEYSINNYETDVLFTTEEIDGENYFFLVENLDNLFEIESNDYILVYDNYRNYSIYDDDIGFDLFKKVFKEKTNDFDRFKIIANVDDYLSGNTWNNCSDKNIDSIFNSIRYSNEESFHKSNFTDLVINGFENSEPNSKLVILSPNSSLGEKSIAENIASELQDVWKDDIEIQLLDYSRRERPSHRWGTTTWWGNEYLHSMLSENDNFSVSYFSDGIFHDNNLERFIAENIDINIANNIKIISSVDLSNGVLTESYYLHDIGKIGKYYGDGDFTYKIYGAYKGDTIFINKNIEKNYYSKSSLKQMFYSSKILEIEESISPNDAKIRDLVDMSMNSNVLSLHTAFLCLEPWRLEILKENDDKDDTPSDVVFAYDESILNSYPNPATSSTTIRINTSFEKLEIYSLEGKLVFSTNVVSDEIAWDLTNFNGQKVNSGTYLIILNTGDKVYLFNLIVL